MILQVVSESPKEPSLVLVSLEREERRSSPNRNIHNDVDSERSESSRGSNSRELKDLRRADDSSTGDERERELDQPSS